MTWSPQTPTEPGAYWWKGYSDALPRLMEVSEEHDDKFAPILVVDSGTEVSALGGLWCRLVAAEEVEKAWNEGCDSGLPREWNNSRAKRVMEGRE